jgi:hypothetical protein
MRYGRSVGAWCSNAQLPVKWQSNVQPGLVPVGAALGWTPSAPAGPSPTLDCGELA